MSNRKSGCFANLLGTVIVVALVCVIGYAGYKTYQKLPVVTFISGLAQAAADMDTDKLSACFTPDSDVRKALDAANTLEGVPILGNLAQDAASFIGSGYNYQLDYSDIHMTVNENAGKAVLAVLDKDNNDQKSYLTLDLEKIDNQWYATQLPSVQTAAETHLSYSNIFQGYAERASDYLALAIFSFENK